MDTALLKTLREGIRQEISHYEELLGLTTREHEILADENYNSELATLAAKKLKIMREINDLTMRIGPLKVRWKLETTHRTGIPEGKSAQMEIPPLLEELGTLLERILGVDEENQRILARLVGGTETQEANKSLNTTSAEHAYTKIASGAVERTPLSKK